MNYQDIKDTHEEMTDAIRRHNEAVADRITAEFARPERPTVEDATNRQGAQIQLALDALHKGNLDDVKRILESL